MLGELYEDKKARDVAYSSKTSNKDKGKVKRKIISSWYKFLKALRKQFYPLGYMQQV